MKKLMVLLLAVGFAGAVAVAQEPVKTQKEKAKVEHKCKNDCKNHGKDAAHKCKSDCKAKANEAGKKCVGNGQNCKGTAAHKCTGKCAHHKSGDKATMQKKVETKK